MYGQISRNDAFGRCGCLPWTWLGRVVKFIVIWILNPLKTSGRQQNSIDHSCFWWIWRLWKFSIIIHHDADDDDDDADDDDDDDDADDDDDDDEWKSMCFSSVNMFELLIFHGQRV